MLFNPRMSPISTMVIVAVRGQEALLVSEKLNTY